MKSVAFESPIAANEQIRGSVGASSRRSSAKAASAFEGAHGAVFTTWVRPFRSATNVEREPAIGVCSLKSSRRASPPCPLSSINIAPLHYGGVYLVCALARRVASACSRNGEAHWHHRVELPGRNDPGTAGRDERRTIPFVRSVGPWGQISPRRIHEIQCDDAGMEGACSTL